MVKNDRKCAKYTARKNIKRTILWLAKNQAVFGTPKEFLCKEFWPFLGPDGSKKCFFWGNGLFLARGLAQGTVHCPPKSGNNGRIEEPSRHPHWSDITGTLDLITLYNMFTRADIQCFKQALQI